MADPAMKLTAGQKLWRVPGDSRYVDRARYVEITKVGRKWATLEDHSRVDIETLYVDSGGYGYSDRCYLSEQDHKAEQDLSAAWSKASRIIGGYGQRPRTTIPRIAAALSLLGYRAEGRALLDALKEEGEGHDRLGER